MSWNQMTQTDIETYLASGEVDEKTFTDALAAARDNAAHYAQRAVDTATRGDLSPADQEFYTDMYAHVVENAGKDLAAIVRIQAAFRARKGA
jgi:hypothetical protein